MPRCYMVKKGQRHSGLVPPPRSPTEAAVAPSCCSPTQQYAHTESPSAGYCQVSGTIPGRSAADTEAALDLLSLAQSLPPLPSAQAQVLTVLQPAPEPAPTPIPLPIPLPLPVYTYTIQPATSIYILAEDPPTNHYQTVETEIQFVDAEVEETYESPPSPQPQDELPKSIPTSVIQHAPKEKARYDCNECGKRYATSSNLSRHKQTHRSLDSVSAKRCGECGKAYVSMPALAMHVLTHRMGHACGVCGKHFSRPWLLRGHIRSHTGEKPYSCASCGKAFADRSNLRAHLQTHSQDKKYECTQCGKGFALKSYLNKHQESACTTDD